MNSWEKIEKDREYLLSSLKRVSTQRAAGEEKGHCDDTLNCNDNGSLPLPSRSILHSSCSPPRSKELRVTFQQDSSDEFLKNKLYSRDLRDNASCAMWKTDQQPLLPPTQRKCVIESSYSDSVPTGYVTPQSLDQPFDSQNFTDVCWPPIRPFVTSGTWPLPQKSTELESRTNRLLQLSSELYVVTHLPDVAIPVRNFSEDNPEKISPGSALSMKSSLQSSKHKPQQTISTQTDSWRENEKLTTGLKTEKQTLLPESKRPSWLGQVFHPDGSDLCTVLRALLDLVDQHWSGPYSLHLSPSFMAKAVHLLMPLMGACDHQNEIRSPERINKPRGVEGDEQKSQQEKQEHMSELNRGEEGRDLEDCVLDLDISKAGYLRRQLTKTQNEVESLKKRLNSSLKEKMTACLSCEAVPLDLTRYLQNESKILQQQEKVLKQLEVTIYNLRTNQRSLVSHNNLLLNMTSRKTTKLSETV